MNNRCKICKALLKPYLNTLSKEYMCSADNHYRVAFENDKPLFEFWFYRSGNSYILQRYTNNSTFIALGLLNNIKNLDLDYLLVDFNNFDEKIWLNKIEMFKFYE